MSRRLVKCTPTEIQHTGFKASDPTDNWFWTSKEGFNIRWPETTDLSVSDWGWSWEMRLRLVLLGDGSGLLREEGWRKKSRVLSETPDPSQALSGRGPPSISVHPNRAAWTKVTVNIDFFQVLEIQIKSFYFLFTFKEMAMLVRLSRLKYIHNYLIYCYYIHVPQRIDLTDFGDSLAFISVSPAGQNVPISMKYLHTKSLIYSDMYWSILWLLLDGLLTFKSIYNDISATL